MSRKIIAILTVAVCVMALFFIMGCEIMKPNLDQDWKLGTQAWSFNRFTFFEAVDKTASLGMKWIEAFPGQKLGGDDPNAKFHHTMTAEQRMAVMRKLADSDVVLVNYGVVGLPNDEAECRAVFEFARAMRIETIVSEPPAEAYDMIDALCREYRIHVALHNHPKPSHYWNPDTVLAAVAGRSEWMGACADTGHWMRSGIVPLEAVKKLEGRIVSFHLKDLETFGDRSAHDVPWGTGKGDLKKVLAELKRQGFRGVFSIEYEYNWETSLPEIAECAAFFNTAVAELN